MSDHHRADVVIYDVFQLAVPGDRARAGELERLVAAHPGRVLALSRLLQPGLTARALAAGAVAPVSIGADADELAGLVEAAAAGILAVDAALARKHHAELARQLGAEVGLTDRERTVLGLIAVGYSNQEIASQLYVSINTIKSTIRSIYRRIDVQTRAQAVAWAIEHGHASDRIPGDPALPASSS